MVVVEAKFKKQFQCCDYPNKKLIYRWVHKFITHGTFLNVNTEVYRDSECRHSDWSKSLRNPDNAKATRDLVVSNPRKSMHRLRQEFGIRRESVRRISAKDQQLNPCRMQIQHKLFQADTRNRANSFVTI